MALLVNQTYNFLFNEEEGTNSIKNEGYGKEVKPKDGIFTKKELAEMLGTTEDNLACAEMRHTDKYMPNKYVECKYLVFNKNCFYEDKPQTIHIIERDGYYTDEYDLILYGEVPNRLVKRLLNHYEHKEYHAKESYLNSMCGDDFKRYNIGNTVLFAEKDEVDLPLIRSKEWDDKLKSLYHEWLKKGKPDEDINDAE